MTKSVYYRAGMKVNYKGQVWKVDHVDKPFSAVYGTAYYSLTNAYGDYMEGIRHRELDGRAAK